MHAPCVCCSVDEFSVRDFISSIKRAAHVFTRLSVLVERAGKVRYPVLIKANIGLDKNITLSDFAL